MNCALGAEKMRPYIETFDRIAECYTHCYPNAGLPNPLSEFGYDQMPADTANYLGEYCADGLLNVDRRLLRHDAQAHRGGRCGVRQLAPRKPKTADALTLAGLELLRIPDSGAPFIFVGERTT